MSDEIVLVEIAKSFRVPAVAREDTFAELQADSIMLLGLTTALQERFDISIDIVDIFLAVAVEDVIRLVSRLTSNPS